MVAAGGVLGMAAEEADQAFGRGRIEEGEVRVFRVSVDVRSFRAGGRLPARAVNAFVRVVLPQSIVKLAMTSPYPANAAKLTAPLRTHPPVLVAKGTEIIIPNGYVALELPSSVVSLSSALAEEPHVLAEVLHSDRYMADSVIGIASIPMAPLLNESRLDGYAPVFSPWDGGGAGVEDQVNIGALRVVLAVEELGPVMGASRKHRREVEHAPFLPVSKQGEGIAPHHINSTSSMENRKGGKGKERKGADEVSGCAGHGKHGPREGCEAGDPFRSTETSARRGVDHGVAPAQSETDLRQTLEYEMAWEFEMWRRSEEVKWRAELKEREMSRMSALEDEWRRREKEHSSEMEKTRKEQDALEAKLKAKLFELEKMERKLVQGQEAATHRKEALEREYAQRLTDAQVAVKRHQSECEHRVELEQGKYTALLEQHAVLEKRLATSNKSLAALEKQFCEYKAAQRNTVEADLAAQLLVQKQQCSDYKARFEAALQSKEEYKAQVLRMAKEIAGFYRSQQDTTRGDRYYEGRILSEVACNDDKHEHRHLREPVHNLRPLEQVEAARTADAMSLEPPSEANSGKCKSPLSKSGNLGQASVRTNVQSTYGQDYEFDEIAAPDSKDAAKPIFAQPVKENERLGVFKGQARYQSKDTEVEGHEKLGNDEGRKPLLEVGQKVTSEVSPALTFHQKGRMQRQSDVENELVEGGLDTAFKEKEIRRLRRQRSELLDTGIYGVSDRIIRGLDTEIRRLETG